MCVADYLEYAKYLLWGYCGFMPIALAFEDLKYGRCSALQERVVYMRC